MTQMFWLVVAVLGAVLVVGGLVLGDDGYTAQLCVICGAAVTVLSICGYIASLDVQRESVVPSMTVIGVCVVWLVVALIGFVTFVEVM